MELTQAQRERIDKGATLLDEKVPDWFTRINPDVLDIDSFSLCPVCQACEGTFWDGLSQLGIAASGDSAFDLMEASEHGFYPHEGEITDDPEEATPLAQAKTDYWLTLITERLEAKS